MDVLNLHHQLIVRSSGISAKVLDTASGEVLYDLPLSVGVVQVDALYRTLPHTMLSIAVDPDDDVVVVNPPIRCTPVTLSEEDTFGTSANPRFKVLPATREARRLEQRFNRLEVRENENRRRMLAAERALNSIRNVNDDVIEDSQEDIPEEEQQDAPEGSAD